MCVSASGLYLERPSVWRSCDCSLCTWECSDRLSGNIVLTPNRQGVIDPINKNATIVIFAVFFDEL